MTGLAEDIADLLVLLGVGQITSPASIFIGELPAQPADAIMVRELAGAAPARAMGPHIATDRPDVYVTVRRTAYQDLVATVNKIIGNGQNKGTTGWGLDGWSGTIDTHVYKLIALAYGPTYQGRDENQRRLTTVVFNIMKDRW